MNYPVTSNSKRKIPLKTGPREIRCQQAEGRRQKAEGRKKLTVWIKSAPKRFSCARHQRLDDVGFPHHSNDSLAGNNRQGVNLPFR